MSKLINFTRENYKELLQQLGSDSAASMPINMELNQASYVVRLLVHSKFAPENPLIEFERHDEYGYWFKITDVENGNINQIYLEDFNQMGLKISSKEDRITIPQSQKKENEPNEEDIQVTKHDPLGITCEDYNKVIAKSGGINTSAGSFHNLIKDKTLYKLSFDMAGTSLDNINARIKFLAKEGNKFKYELINEDNQGILSGFSIEYHTNQEIITSELKKEELLQVYSNITTSNLSFLPYKEKTHYYTLNKQKVTYTFNNFLLTTQVSGDESSHPGNSENLKLISKTYFEDGHIHFSTNKQIACTNDNSFIYVVDKSGTLYTHAQTSSQGAVHHSYFIKGKTDSQLYGYGRPTASAGTIKINSVGKIIEIDNSSGHYGTLFKQVLIVAKHFKSMGVLSDNCIIKNHVGAKEAYAVDYLDQLDTTELLGEYSTIDEISI